MKYSKKACSDRRHYSVSHNGILYAWRCVLIQNCFCAGFVHDPNFNVITVDFCRGKGIDLANISMLCTIKPTSQKNTVFILYKCYHFLNYSLD